MGIKIKHISATICCLLMLSACGGGGGSSDDSSGSGSGSGSGGGTTSPITLSGSAFKGILNNAVVNVYEIVDGQIANSPTATTYTDEFGLYEFETNELSNIVYVTVSGRDDETSLMQCDLRDCGVATADSVDSDNNGVITFGEWIQINSDFELSAFFVDWQPSDSPSVNLLTHIVAENLESIDSDSIATAYQQVGSNMGLSSEPYELSPVDVSEELEQADIESLKVSALLSLLDTSDTDIDIISLIDDLLSSNDVLPNSEDFSEYKVTIATMSIIQSNGNVDETALEAMEQIINQLAEQEGTLQADLLPPGMPPML